MGIPGAGLAVGTAAPTALSYAAPQSNGTYGPSYTESVNLGTTSTVALTITSQIVVANRTTTPLTIRQLGGRRCRCIPPCSGAASRRAGLATSIFICDPEPPARPRYVGRAGEYEPRKWVCASVDCGHVMPDQ
ncbi:hypothetical protein QF050_001819 [Arthrobacter sp. SLBN-112]|nr:hypothetical protein [Arthrobacter sp. SLBN-112]